MGKTTEARPGTGDVDGPTTFASGRYTVRSVLGEGGQKVVYLVHDEALERDCALSLLRGSNLSLESVQRLQREAKAMARLQGDPRIVSVYDMGDEGGAPYLVSEYVGGGDLRQELRAHTDGLAFERLIAVASDVAGALTVAHEQGIVHRDVTPANVWLTDAGRSKLGDFGVASGTEDVMSLTGGLIGTPAYMAPEQALGQRCDAQSDLYSLGVIMYEMATGRRPFVSDDPLAVVSQHINTSPVAPRWHNPSIPPALETLILALLAKAPDDRPLGGAAVSAALDALRIVSGGEAPELAALNPLERLAGGVFVGRDDELGELRAAVESAISGQRNLVMVAGEPGIGKSRITEQLSTYARLRRAVVFWGRCVEGEGAPAFWPWIQIMRAHAETLDDSELRDCFGDGSGQLAHLLPELGARLGSDAALSPNPEQARFQQFEAVAGWLRRAAQRAPLVLLLDDLHWADEPSLLLLQHLADALRDERLLLVGTYRDAEVGRGHPLERVIAELPRLGRARQVVLHGLSEDDVRSYIALATGREPPRHLVETVFRQTEGNPLFVGEVVRMLTTSSRIDGADESWTQEIPAGVRGVIERRLSQVSEPCREILATASVIGRAFESRVLQRVAEAAPDDVLDALDDAMAAQLVLRAPDAPRQQGSFLFSHALVRDVLYEGLRSSKRLRLHARTADVLQELFGADAGPRISALAHHFRESAALGDVSKAVEYSVRASDAAREVYAYEEAVRQLDAAIALLEQAGRPEEEADLLQRAADVMYLSGVNFHRGAEYLERALGVWERAGDQLQQAATHTRMGRIFTTYQDVVDIPRATKHLEAAIDLLGKGEPGVALVHAYVGLAAAHDRALRTQDGLEAAQKARSIAEMLGRERLTAMAMFLEGTFMVKQGHMRSGSDLQDAASELADRFKDVQVSYYRGWFRGFRDMHYYGDPVSATQHYLGQLEKPHMAQAVLQREQLLKVLVDAYFACGDIAALRSCGASETDECYGEDNVEGRWEQVAIGFSTWRSRCRDGGNRLSYAGFGRVLARELFHLGRLDEAVVMLREAIQTVFGQDVGPELDARIWLCIVQAEAGRAEPAREQLDHCDEIVSRGEDWKGQIGRIEMARGVALSCEKDTNSAERAFAEAITILQRYRSPWDEAEAFRQWGRALASAGDHPGAMEKFQRAIDVYRRIGAGAPWIARIVREYAGDGGGGAESTRTST